MAIEGQAAGGKGASPMVVGRFAPTPSGRMHLGNALAALLAWLSAKSQGGRILLRIEDLDLIRTSPQYTEMLLDDLHWLGLGWDETAPNQSTRTAFYEAQLEKLSAKGLLYPCYCSRAALHANSAANPANAPHAADGSYVYNRRCLGLSPEERAEKEKQRGGAVRVMVPNERVGFCDGLQGWYEETLEADCGDFILRRSDGVFAYQLAAPADDGAEGVTEVVRGRDLLASTPRQIWLLGQLGYAAPRYCHLPLLLAPDGRRLSKRDEDLDLGLLRRQHAGPEKLVGALAHLAGLLPAPRALRAGDLLETFDWKKIKKEDILLKGAFL